MKRLLLILMALIAVYACSPDTPFEPAVNPPVQPEPEPDPDPDPDPEPEPQPRVFTGDTQDVGPSSAIIISSYSDAPARGVFDRGIYYGTSESDLEYAEALGSSTSREDNFTIQLSDLEANTTYYYQAYITLPTEDGHYMDYTGDILSFTTSQEDPGGDPDPHGEQSASGLQYLHGYEIPAVSLTDNTASSDSGSDSSGPWWTYFTPNADQRIVTHAFKGSGKQWRNWTALIDRTKQAPLWSAFIMHQDISPRSGSIGRGSWHKDPALPDEWQSCFASGNYHRGHLVANAYRQKYTSSRNQTFYYTNQALQEQNNFNGAIWERLENQVRSIAPSGRDTLYVVVGLLYEGTPRIMDGKEAPSHFYKLLMYCEFNTEGSMQNAKGVAYLMENLPHSDKDYDNEKYRTSIDAIEQRTGFDFFTNVPKTLQDAAESTSATIW